MKISDDLRRCVVFIGYPFGDDIEDPTGFEAIGTAFMLAFSGQRYLVTALHIAVDLSDDPFTIRINKSAGGAENIHIDPINHGMKWHYNKADPSVDVAVMPLNIAFRDAGFETLYIPEEMILGDGLVSDWGVGIGDACYTIGLFSLVQGRQKNLPVVHVGNIALSPDDDRIPMQDWAHPLDETKIVNVSGYLVETQNLKGLSGSPVFVRPTVSLTDFPLPSGKEAVTFGLGRLLLLGLWSGSWDAPPSAVLAREKGENVRVPVGMGVVVPAQKIIQILEREELEVLREENRKKWALSAIAKPDSTENPEVSS